MKTGSRTWYPKSQDGPWTTPTLRIDRNEVEEILGHPIRNRAAGTAEPPEDELEMTEEENEDLHELHSHILNQDECPEWVDPWGFDADVTASGDVTFEGQSQPAAA